MKPGEKLIRTLIDELNGRISVLERAVADGSIGQRYWRYRHRWITADYERLRGIAQRYGFDV
jgi:hypothetical protein